MKLKQPQLVYGHGFIHAVRAAEIRWASAPEVTFRGPHRLLNSLFKTDHQQTPIVMSMNPFRPTQRRWRIAWLLALGVLVNYFDRVNLSVSHDALITTFGISNIAFGYLSGAYNWTYALCQLPVGVVLDRFGIRRIGRVSTFIWSVASFAAAAASGLGSFFGARFLLGVGEAPTFPASAKAIGHWFPPKERTFSTALFDSSAKFGLAIGAPLIGILLLRIGWRWSFAATGFISLAYFALFWRVYRDPQEDSHLTGEERQAHPGTQGARPAGNNPAACIAGVLAPPAKGVGACAGVWIV